ncbi:MAG: ATP-binding protein, partial [bacterium]
TMYIVLSICLTISLVLMVNRRLLADVKTQEEKFTTAFHSSPYAITLTRPSDGTIFEVNEGFVSITGYRYAEVIGKTTLGLNLWVREEDRLAVTNKLAQGREIHGVEYQFRKKTGESLTGFFSANLVTINNETCILASIGDITERKRAEEKLQKSEALLNDVGEMARVGGWELDVETKQVLWTSETYRIHEIPEGEEIDLSKALLFFDLPQRSALEIALQRCMETEEGFDLEIPFTSAKGRHLWTRALGRAVKVDGKVVRLTGTFQDITERKQLEERIRQVRSDLLFAVSHDLKSPLQALNQSQEMLSALQPGEGLARFQEYSEIWRRNLQRLERMINNLLDSQRGEEGRFPLLLAPCDAAQLVKSAVVDSQGYALSSAVSFDLKLQPVPQGSCDEEALARVVENLLTNAVKFSQKGGKVEIRLGMEGDTIQLEVEDWGCGIAKTEQEKLFQPFQRGRSAQQKRIPGTGLGLYVCRRIVEEHGGSISLTSEEGKGTTVIVRLPWRV